VSRRRGKRPDTSLTAEELRSVAAAKIAEPLVSKAVSRIARLGVSHEEALNEMLIAIFDYAIFQLKNEPTKAPLKDLVAVMLQPIVTEFFGPRTH
jgi:hypothetical protein